MYFAQEIENLLIYFYNIINSILFSFLVLFKELVVLEPDRNNVGILLCTVKAIEWLKLESYFIMIQVFKIQVQLTSLYQYSV